MYKRQALLSRCQVYILNPLEKKDLEKILINTVKTDIQLKDKGIEIKESEALIELAGGDARKLLSLLEIVVQTHNSKKIEISNALVFENY